MKKARKKTKKKNWRNEAWTWFSIFIRLFYADWKGNVKCYTCGKEMFWKGDGAQAGHFQGGRRNAVLLDERGVRVQCYGCNVGKKGEQYKFGKRLEGEIGEDTVRELEENKGETVYVSQREWEEKASHYQLEAVKIATEKGLEI